MSEVGQECSAHVFNHEVLFDDKSQGPRPFKPWNRR